MPSIPQSLLWISLVVLWLFVLVPMLISKRDTVRRTSDVALATRVLNTGRGVRGCCVARGPAAGHHSDPDWRPSEDDLDDDLDEDDDDDDEHEDAPSRRPVVLAAAAVQAEPDYLDVDIVEDGLGALPVGVVRRGAAEEVVEPELPLEFDDNTQTFSVDDLSEVDVEVDAMPNEAEPESRPRQGEPDVESDETTDMFEPLDDGTDHDYEYVDDSSGLEAPSEADLRVADSMIAGAGASATSPRPPPRSARASTSSASGC